MTFVIINALKNKLHVIGHAIKFDEFYRKIDNFNAKDFAMDAPILLAAPVISTLLTLLFNLFINFWRW